MRKILGLAAIGILAVATAAQAQRDQIRIVGSSTVYPFATKVAESFGRGGSFKTPIVESTGTGGGFKIFCSGVGPEFPDINDASRRIKQTEIEACASKGAKDLIEVPIGYDGIVVASSKRAPHLRLTRKQLFLALAKSVPTAMGSTKPNTARTWADIDKSLPAAKIEVFGPPPTSGTRDAFVELVMELGCKQTWPWLAQLEKDDNAKFKQICDTMREDGGWVDAGENDNLIVQKLEANPNAFGVFGYSFLEENKDKVQGASVEGFDPTFDNVAALKYPISRPLFFYVKKAHLGVIPGLKEFIAEFTSAKAIGEDGYATEIGLIPLPAPKLQQAQNIGKSLAPNVR
ncbi:MAG TPA: PstS family phosphate ABC transporter substrate-binding protein [Thermoanaerobaculia bacterium]|jgi:phosphate transport system substrate-binding protein|nr:PstS family phosphate ABC transporter substrate-binding protein [Thermoanaerobaculia bacterium]